MATMTLRGDKELRAAFGRLGAAAQGNIMQSALLSGGWRLQEEVVKMIRTVPSKARRRAGEPIWLTGNLARSIQVVREGDRAVDVGTNVEYAARLEFGFTGRDSRGRNYHQPPNPWFRPALAKASNAIQREIGRIFWQGVREIAALSGGKA